MRPGCLQRLDQWAEEWWRTHTPSAHAGRADKWTQDVISSFEGSHVAQRLAELDRKASRRRVGDGWLVALAFVGLALSVLTVIGLIYGHGVGGDLPVTAVIFVLPLAEIWRRRQQERGREAFRLLEQLDERVYTSKWGHLVPGSRKWHSWNGDR